MTLKVNCPVCGAEYNLREARNDQALWRLCCAINADSDDSTAAAQQIIWSYSSQPNSPTFAAEPR